MDRLQILIVDDERGARLGMRRALEKEGYDLTEVQNGQEGLDRIAQGGIDLVMLDCQMPVMDGMQVLEKLSAQPNPPLVVMCTAFGSEKIAVEAIKRGAYDYVAKPYDVEELRLLVRRATEQAILRKENLRLKEELAAARGTGELLGSSASMRRVLDRLDKAAPTEITVLITGESGTGKELVAKAIHQRSNRARAPFVVFDCSNVDKGLIRSELFGHEKGAYTGAESDRAGSFERANNGTLFIDEVGELDLELQPRLLRVLETREVVRLGSDKPRKVNVRLIAATNRDLSKMVKEGTFREDLYHRLSVVNIALPPLRERVEDIPLFATRFLEETAGRLGRTFRGITPEALSLLMEQHWSGNVRELKNAIEAAAVLAEGDVLEPEDFTLIGERAARAPATPEDAAANAVAEATLAATSLDANLPFKEAKRRLVLEFEKRYIAAKLDACGGNISKAARELGMHRQSLQQKLKSLGIKEPAE